MRIYLEGRDPILNTQCQVKYGVTEAEVRCIHTGERQLVRFAKIVVSSNKTGERCINSYGDSGERKQAAQHPAVSAAKFKDARFGIDVFQNESNLAFQVFKHT